MSFLRRQTRSFTKGCESLIKGLDDATKLVDLLTTPALIANMPLAMQIESGRAHLRERYEGLIALQAAVRKLERGIGEAITIHARYQAELEA